MANLYLVISREFVWPSLQISRFTPGLCEQGIDLVEGLMAIDPRRRLSALEAMKHPYFDDMNSM